MKRLNNRSKLTVYILLLLLCQSGILFAQEFNDIIDKADSSVYAVSWSPDGQYFATASNNAIKIWFADSNTTKTFFVEQDFPVLAGKFSSDSRWFLSVCQNNIVTVRSLENQTAPSRIKVGKEYPVKDADFIGTKTYSVAVPSDGRELLSCYNLVTTQQAVQRSIIKTNSTIYSVNTARDGKTVLLGLEDGHVMIVNSDSGEVLQDVVRYVNTNIKPRFSPDGKEWVAAGDKENLLITSSASGNTRIIRDMDFFLNVAVFSPDGEHIAASMDSGTVKIFNAKNCQCETTYYLSRDTDVVLSLDYSPDGKSLLAGTKDGYIYRWSVDGPAYDFKKDLIIEEIEPPAEEISVPEPVIPAPVEEKPVPPPAPAPAPVVPAPVVKQEEVPQVPAAPATVVVPPVKAPEEATQGTVLPAVPGSVIVVQGGSVIIGDTETDTVTASVKKSKLKKFVSPKPVNSLDFTFSYNSLPKYYVGNYSLGLGYRRYDFNPCYLVADFGIGMAPANDDFPYTYYVNGKELKAPSIYTVSSSCGAGYCYNFADMETILFSEIRTGFNFRSLCTNNLNAFILTMPVAGLYGELMLGVQWQSLRFAAGCTYDSNFKSSLKIEVAVSQKMKPRKKTVAKEVKDEK